MAGLVTKGNCFICGSTLSKSDFKKHALTAHTSDAADGQDCAVLKIESSEDKNYWLFVDIPLTSSLKSLDTFLRAIWLECCGHMSAFFAKAYGQLGMAQKISSLSDIATMHYEYDFGSTTELLITFIGKHRRPKQRKAVRLIGRNEPIGYYCGQCGGEADYICMECMYDECCPFFCETCLQEHEHDSVLPVTNSPRMGVCGYCGELDEYEFDPQDFD